MDVLDEAATREALRQLPGWELTPDALAKTFKFDGWTREDMALARRINRRQGEHDHPVGLAGPS